jgi:rhodanese-related sulfurtransferase
MFTRNVLLQIITLLLLSGTTSISFNYFQPHGIPLIAKSRTPPSKYERLTASQDDKVSKKELSLDEAYTLFKTKGGLFIDARSDFFYKAAHISGAISIFFRTAQDNPLLKEIPKDKALIAYCGGIHCNQALQLLDKLENAGFTNVYVFNGGMEDWRAAGYPIDEQKITPAR